MSTCTCSVALLKDLPIIIDAPGEYVTRDGRRVVISDLDGKGTFSCHGHLYTPKKSGRGFTEKWNIWHVSGLFQAIKNEARDIVRKA